MSATLDRALASLAIIMGPKRRATSLQLSQAVETQEWLRPAFERMLEFLSLEENWNGYGERPVQEDAVERAVNVLNKICPNGPSPVVVPTAEGGLQLEWSSGGLEIEVEIPPSGPALIFILEPSGQETETTATAQSETWKLLKQKLARYSRRPLEQLQAARIQRNPLTTNPRAHPD